MSKGKLQHVTATYRQQLAARDAQAEQRLEMAYQHTLASIQPQIDRLIKQIADMQAAGQDIPVSWLYQEKRLANIQRVITEQINHFGTIAQATTEQLQRDGVQLAQEAAQAQIDALLPKDAVVSLGNPSIGAIQSIVGATGNGSPLSTLFDGFGAEASQSAKEALVRGITLGSAPRKVAKDLQDALGVSRDRALTIAHNEMMRSYRSSSLETYRANSSVIQGWAWLADLSGACLACTEENGSVHPLDEDMASHVRCRCSPVPLTSADSAASGIQDGSEWFAEQDEATQRGKLGDARYQLYQDGMPLSDMVGTKHDPDWGSSVYIKPLKDLQEVS